MAKLQPTQSASLIGANNPRVTSPRNAQGIGGSPCPTPANAPETIITALARQDKALDQLHADLDQLCGILADILRPAQTIEPQGYEGPTTSRLRESIDSNTRSIDRAIYIVQGIIGSSDLC